MLFPANELITTANCFFRSVLEGELAYMYHRLWQTPIRRIPKCSNTLSAWHLADRSNLYTPLKSLACTATQQQHPRSSLVHIRSHASLAKSVPDTIGQRNANDRHPHEDSKAEQKPDQALAKAEEVVDTRTQRQKDYAIVKQLLPNIWPKGDSGTKTRVVLAVGLLVAGKVG